MNTCETFLNILDKTLADNRRGGGDTSLSEHTANALPRG
jgi:hypothetical protein